MKKESFLIISLMAFAVCIGFVSCNNSTSPNIANNDVPHNGLNWKEKYNLYEGKKNIPAITFSPSIEGDSGSPLSLNEGEGLSIAYGNGTIVIGGGLDGKIAYSGDWGETWNVVDSGLDDGIRSLAYANGAFVATGINYNDDDPNKIIYSSNGKDWSITRSSNIMRGYFVFSAGDTFFIRSGIGGPGYYSSDGRNWNDCEDGGNDVYWAKNFRDIVYGNGTYVYAGNNKTNGVGLGIINYSKNGGAIWETSKYIWKNENGENVWTTNAEYYDEERNPLPCGDILNYFDTLICGDGTFIIAGSDYDWQTVSDDDDNEVLIRNPRQYPDGLDANIITSNDGINWTRRSCGIEPDVFGFGAGTFVALSNTAQYSNDKGVSWKKAKGNFGSTAFYDIVYGGGYFIAMGVSEKQGKDISTLYYSDNAGKSWKAMGNEFDSIITKIIYENGLFIAVGANGKIFIAK